MQLMTQAPVVRPPLNIVPSNVDPFKLLYAFPRQPQQPPQLALVVQRTNGPLREVSDGRCCRNLLYAALPEIGMSGQFRAQKRGRRAVGDLVDADIGTVESVIVHDPLGA